MRVLAFDFGASTGRAIVGEVIDGRLKYEEVNRFDNVPYIKDGHMYWDFGTLMSNVLASIKMAGDIDSIGIDTWGVDYGVIDKSGNLKGDPYHYRDDRTSAVFERITTDMPDLYARTGIQVMKINTMFQLVAHKEQDGFDSGDKILFMPDLFAYMLTGVMRSEYTIATTSGLVKDGDWNIDLIDELGLDRDIFSPIIKNGTAYGYLKEDIRRDLGISRDIKVVAVCTHDTASAITSMVTSPSESMYVSSGTWSLFGIETNSTCVDDANFTNEGGYNGSITYLSNIMGLWLIQEFRRKLKREDPNISFPDLERMMGDSEVGKYIVDTNDARFVAPPDMEVAIRDYIREHYGREVTRGEIVRCIYDSLANEYMLRAKALNSRYNGKYNTINILGGGSQATPLVKRTAELTHMRVVAGPIEATAIGNMLVQLISLGVIKDIDEARCIVKASESVMEY